MFALSLRRFDKCRRLEGLDPLMPSLAGWWADQHKKNHEETKTQNTECLPPACAHENGREFPGRTKYTPVKYAFVDHAVGPSGRAAGARWPYCAG